jgi:segregation and condensation protein B
LSVQELSEVLGLPDNSIRNYIKKLKTKYSSRDSALEIAKVGTKYSMQVKSDLADHIKSLAPMEIPQKVLKTAALIAYHQPIKQSDLQEMFGPKVYDHVKVLSELGLIMKRNEGRTIVLTTTSQFSEYFGIDTTNREKMRQWLTEKIKGIENVSEKPKEHRKISEY